MLLYTNYVCKPDVYKIDINGITGNTVTISLVYDDKTIFKKKYWFKELDSIIANRIINSFCDHVINKDDGDDFMIRNVQESLEKVWSKAGLLVWRRPSYK